MRLKSERTTSGTLGSFARELISSLSPSVDITPAFLEEKGRKLWELGWNFVQGGKNDDRILYFSRLEVMGALRDVLKIDLPPLTANHLNIFEYFSRGLTTTNGSDAKIEFGSANTKKVVVTGFDPFLLPEYGLVSNPSGTVALSFHNNSTEFPTAEVRTAIFPVRFKDFGNSGEGLVETVMKEAVKTASLIMTCSRGNSNYDVDRFVTRYRGPGANDNLRIKSVGTNTNPSNSPTPFFESTLPYTSVISATKKQMLDGPGGSTPFLMNQSYQQASKSRGYPSRGFADSSSFTKYGAGDLPDDIKEMTYGSGGDYLSNEIPYRTAMVRDNNRKDLPTGHLHLPIIDSSSILNVQTQGEKVVKGVSMILKEFMNYALEIVFPDTKINPIGVSGTTTLTNLFKTPEMQLSPAISIATMEISPPSLQPNFQIVTSLPINNIASGTSKDIEIKFVPTEEKEYLGIAKLKDSSGNVLFTISLKGKGTKPPLPKITSFSPLGGNIGRKVTIIGENFVNVIDVRIDGSVTFNVIDSTKIEAFVTPNAFTSVIEVETSAGTATSSDEFVVFGRPSHRD